MKKKTILVFLVYLIVMDLLLETVDCKSIRSKKHKRTRSRNRNKSKRRRQPVVDEYIDVGVGHPDSGLRRAFLRFLKDSLRQLERSDTKDKGPVKLAVGVPLGLVTAYGIYADYCDVETKHPLCNLPMVLAPKISAVTQRLFGFNFVQRVKALFNK